MNLAGIIWNGNTIVAVAGYLGELAKLVAMAYTAAATIGAAMACSAHNLGCS